MNELLLTNMIKKKIDGLCVRFQHSKDALKILNDYIDDNLMEYMNGYEDIKKHIDDYVCNFLYEDGEKYYYIKETDTFIEYKNHDYKVIDEDIIWAQIYEECGENSNGLIDYSETIKDTIISKIKERDIKHVIPESNTIQKIISFFTPLFSKTKEDVKYFLTILGDIYIQNIQYIQKDTRHLVFYVPEYSKQLIEYIINSFELFFGEKGKNSNIFKYKYNGRSYNESRIIKFRKNAFCNNTSFWTHFLNENILNILMTGIHYSVRYVNSDNYASRQLNLKYVFQLRDNTIDSIINEFKNSMIITDENNTLTSRDIYFLWNLFLDTKGLPSIMYKNDFLGKIGELKNMNSQYLEPARYFTSFWSENILCFDENEDELEMSELAELYSIWLKNKKNKIMKQEEYHLEELIKYFYIDVIIKNKKYVQHVSCTMWDKKSDIKQALDNSFDKNLKNDVTKLEAFRAYCGYAGANNFINIASKNYFKKYIEQIIPIEFIKNNKILKEYWTSR